MTVHIREVGQHTAATATATDITVYVYKTGSVCIDLPRFEEEESADLWPTLSELADYIEVLQWALDQAQAQA